MKIEINVDIKEICTAVAYDTRKIRIIADEFTNMINRISTMLKCVDKIDEASIMKKVAKKSEKPKEPEKKVAPAQPKKEKSKWNSKQQKDIDAIKKAVADRKKEDGRKKGSRTRTDIDNDVVVRMYEKEGKSFLQIAKELNCSQQTVANRYNKAKGIN